MSAKDPFCAWEREVVKPIKPMKHKIFLHYHELSSLPLQSVEMDGLTIGENNRMRAMRSEERRIEFVRSRRFMKLALAKTLGKRPQEIQISSTAGTKPRLKNSLSKDLDFNFSHCHDLWVSAIGFTKNIGVDVESCDRLMHESVARRLMTVKERQLWNLLSQNQRQASALRTWCQKEAVIKSNVLGKNASPKSFEVEVHPKKAVRYFGSGLFLHEHKITNEHIAIIACPFEKIDLQILKLPYEEYFLTSATITAAADRTSSSVVS